MSLGNTSEKQLGAYLRDRRTRLDPASFGLPLTRRRTAGLRREEVAIRANMSTTWYTWLEQGRGGAPSADILDRISNALLLLEVEREHLYLLALGRPPDVRYQAADAVTPRLQRVLDALTLSPAYVKNSSWDIVAWNRAATVVLTDYGALEPVQRNILRLIFSDPTVREKQSDWESVARFVVAAFRADVARAGATKAVQDLVNELCRASREFEVMWRNNDVRSTYGELAKVLLHPTGGAIALEYSAFAVDGRPDLDLVVYNPLTVQDKDRINKLMDGVDAVDARAVGNIKRGV